MDAATVLETLEYRLAPLSLVGRIGLIVLSTDEIGDNAYRTIIPSSAFHVSTTRTDYNHGGDDSGAFRPATSFRAVADSLPPEGRLDLIAFSCTSATVQLGVQAVLEQLSDARPGLLYTSPGIGGLRALRAMGLDRIALLTPYRLQTHKLFVPFFEDEGFKVVSDATFGLAADAEIGELSKASLFEAAHHLTRSGSADALFVSCTATPIVPHIAELEAALGLPVVTSTQAMAWDSMRLLGYGDPVEGFGRLLTLPR